MDGGYLPLLLTFPTYLPLELEVGHEVVRLVLGVQGQQEVVDCLVAVIKLLNTHLQVPDGLIPL